MLHAPPISILGRPNNIWFLLKATDVVFQLTDRKKQVLDALHFVAILYIPIIISQKGKR
jgi:hypothetical protein